MFSKKFIAATAQYSMGEKGWEHVVSAPMFRREFHWENNEKVIMTVCGLGLYKLYINGKNITKGTLAPYISNPDVYVYYDVYDITEHLQKGKNVIGILLGNGFLNPQVTCWDFEKSPFRCAPKFAISVEMNGQLAFEADEQFFWMPSPILYNDLRFGEHYDARKEIADWCTPEYSAEDWHKPISALTPKGEPKICTAEPVRCTRTVKSVAHWKTEGGFVYDFGENVAGVCTLNICGWQGQVVRFQHGETLLEGRSLYIRNIVVPEITNKLDWQTDVYICRGTGKMETYTPHFTYHGFRYVFIEGIADEQATNELLTMNVLHSEFTSNSNLTTDCPVINSLQEMTVRSNLSNILYVITDCPQREKNGWTGDIALSCEQMLYNHSCEATMEEWLRNLCRSQRDDGAVPAICPTSGWGYEWGNGPGWDKALVEVPYQLYRFSGNKNPILESIDTIERYVPYLMSRQNEDGLFAFGLPDWCETLSMGEHLSSTPLEVTDSLTCIEILRKAAFLADVVNHSAFANVCRGYAQEILNDFRKKYVTEDMFISCRTQTAQAMALFFDIFTAEEQQQAFQNLLFLIEEVGYFKVGAIGARVLFRVLADYGEHELAYKLITQDSLPSYKWWINQGLTTLGESINETYPGSSLRKDGSRMLSLNHHFWGDISAWFYLYILGLHVNPTMGDANHIALCPVTFGNVGYAKGTYVRNGKRLTVEVHKEKDGAAKITVLENTGFCLDIGDNLKV